MSKSDQAAIVVRSLLAAERSSWVVGVLVGWVIDRLVVCWPVSWDVVVAVDMERTGLRVDGLRDGSAGGNLLAAFQFPPASPWNAPMLNRSAVVVRYREAFRDWLRSVGVEEEEFQDHGEKSVYLIGECHYPEDQEEVLQESSAAIFYEEVSAWHLDPKQHPDFNDFALFQSWFEAEYFDMVSDVLDEPLTKDE